MRRIAQNGSTLIMALFISILLLLIGMGFLGQREGQYRAAQEQIYFLQARVLADAGLEDALGKLAKDIEFPPIRSRDQGVFSYQEFMRDSNGDVVGSFRVSIDANYRDRPYSILRIHSVGNLGPEDDPLARVKRVLEIDMASTARAFNNGTPNPNLFNINFTKTNSL
jgi:hypothetical protein